MQRNGAIRPGIDVKHPGCPWAGDQKERKSSESLVGKTLFLAVFADDSDLPADARAGERDLGMRFGQVLSNVDRHRIQPRAAAQRYAAGGIGLGRLLLVRLRWEHESFLMGQS